MERRSTFPQESTDVRMERAWICHVLSRPSTEDEIKDVRGDKVRGRDIGDDSPIARPRLDQFVLVAIKQDVAFARSEKGVRSCANLANRTGVRRQAGGEDSCQVESL